MPKISVIIPNYNHADYLQQRINSVVNQTFQDFEVILLDDKSTDNSRDILEKYRTHPKVSTIIYNEQNSGSTFIQWEKGIKQAKGEYIWIAESDDWCEPTLLEHLIEGIEQDQDCVISYCQSYCIQDSNKINWSSSHKQLSEITEGENFMRTQMLLHNPIFNASMVLWKKSKFSEISYDYKNYKLCGDWLFWIELSRLGKVHISGRLLNYFRKHEKDVSGKAMKSGLNFIETLTIINMLFKRQMISDKDYYKAFKMQYREYYPLRNSFESEFKSKIEQLFRNPLTSKSTYYKILAGTLWKHRRK
ncbi:glycosyltransferase family 2 protein [Pedobacter sp. GR22-6]|uniref:glycosyltransferase family 2 protein n=1 Tax=Pedobacter sp. GR22-6 TaxID=3127957 RepID=UPI00307DDEC8